MTAVYKGRYFLDPDEGINYFRRGVEDNTVGVRHVCLMLNEGEGRNYNEKVFLVLRKWITVLRRLDSGSKSLCAVAEQIALHATILLNKGFLRNVEKIRTDINIESNTLVFRPIKRAEDQPIKLVVPHPDHFYGKIKEYNPSVCERVVVNIVLCLLMVCLHYSIVFTVYRLSSQRTGRKRDSRVGSFFLKCQDR